MTRFARAIVGALAPWSIQCLMSVTSCGVQGSSLFGGMIGLFCREQKRNRLLSAALPGTTAGPRLPPFITPAWVLMSNLPSTMLPEWQTVQRFSKIGSMCLE